MYARRVSTDRLIFMAVGRFVCLIAAFICVFPFLMVISGSFTSQTSILRHGYSLIPREFSLSAYKMAFLQPRNLITAYGLTTFVTIAGTLLGLFITAMTGYVLTRRDFDWRNKFAFFFYFTTLFNGGIVPWYILCVRYLNLTDSVLALILPFMLSVFYILVMKGFMSSIPIAISESAKIDGAGDFQIFIRLILPLSKPALASVGLFLAIRYWNDWFTSYMFIQNTRLYSLQYYLYRIVSGAEALRRMVDLPGYETSEAPTESLKMAMVIITTGPIVLLYPFVQRYFISGLTIGSVKG